MMFVHVGISIAVKTAVIGSALVVFFKPIENPSINKN